MIAQLRRIDFRLYTTPTATPHRVGRVPHHLDQTGPVQRSCSGRRSTGQRGGAACTGSRTPSLTRRPHFVFHQVAPRHSSGINNTVIIGDGRRRRFSHPINGPMRSDAVTTNFSCVPVVVDHLGQRIHIDPVLFVFLFPLSPSPSSRSGVGVLLASFGLILPDRSARPGKSSLPVVSTVVLPRPEGRHSAGLL